MSSLQLDSNLHLTKNIQTFIRERLNETESIIQGYYTISANDRLYSLVFTSYLKTPTVMVARCEIDLFIGTDEHEIRQPLSDVKIYYNVGAMGADYSKLNNHIAHILADIIGEDIRKSKVFSDVS